MDQPRKPATGSRRAPALTSAAKQWHTPRTTAATTGRSMDLRPPFFLVGSAGRQEAAHVALVALLTGRLERETRQATASPQGLDFAARSRCPRLPEPAQEETSR
jgi:hypothetical protein